MASGNIKAWISAFRLRTLPLSLSVILMGSFLAAFQGSFAWPIFLLAILTTLCLQILSNLANDYGDTEHGADSLQRIGPSRAVQSGAISKNAMKRAILVFSLLSLISGLALIFVALNDNWLFVLLFLALGLGAITAAIKYTAGNNPYGYRGLGDIFVFLFFGLVGVLGSYYLFVQSFDWTICLPAAAMGFLSTGVLNMNNMRDHVSDEQAGKITLVVRMGFQTAKIYQVGLVLSAITCAILFTAIHFQQLWQYLFLLILPLLGKHIQTVVTAQEPILLDKQLKVLAISTLLFSILFGIGLLV
ncbi:MAG: 1,4-dihydroxy-2-naphthoate polyprenyltransferase [Chitinophagales bacterium]|nr:1,4-dihydroxy-2-naphthoate polyprenyltransferase [Chitinophagales bacterium]